MSETEDGIVYLSDMNGQNLYASPALYDLTGQAPGSIAGSGWHAMIHPDDLDYVRTFFADVQQRRQSFAGWWRYRTSDGSFIWTLVGGMPFISEITGVPIGYLGQIKPLERPDAFVRAGGVMGPELGCQTTPQDNLPPVERIADLTLMASAMARENGETDIARALDAALLKIGFRIAALMKRSGSDEARPKPEGRARAAAFGFD